MPHFGDYQTEIYFKGLRGVLPSLPADFKLLEQMLCPIFCTSDLLV
jgi:hypothetical protein